MPFQPTTATSKLHAMTRRVRIVQGGTSAGKTYGILPILIDTAIYYPNTEISIVSETMPHLRKGAMRDFLKIMEEMQIFIPERWNKTTYTYTFGEGSYIEFFSADSQAKVRGPRRDVLYVNECNNIDFETYSQLAIRTRSTIWLDYNPTHEFWANTELNDEDTERLILTYKDNESLSDTIIKEIEKARAKAFFDEFADDLFSETNIKSSYWANWWKVYGLGEVGSVQGVVFSNWQTVTNIPKDAQLLGCGLDFGFSTDVTAIVSIYRYDGEIYVRELCYQTGMTNQDIAQYLKSLQIQPNTLIIADCAEPKSIAEINRYGFHLQPCTKGADSINFGIDTLQQYRLNVTEDSVYLIKELRNYTWETDKTGAKTGRPIDAYNHLIDALRYIAVKVLAKQNNTPARGIRVR
jgi:phage terminase large subunit